MSSGATKPRLRVLSLGAGVQSTTLALMAAAGEIEAPDCAIFADTGWEPKAVYQHPDRLERCLPFPVHRVSKGNLREDVIAKARGEGGRYAAVPWHLLRKDGTRAMGRRQCTNEYKLAPLYRKAREILAERGMKHPRPGAVEMLIGISTDEASRMKPARVQYVENRWPLIERGLSRRECEVWMGRRGWQAPKSACLGCPFHNTDGWRQVQAVPEEWTDTVEIDRLVRDGGKLVGIRSQQFMHFSLRPLEEVDLRTDAERGQLSLFGDECEGMCGV
jgi:hypothetical protein